MRYIGSKESLTDPIIRLLNEKGLLQRNYVFFDAFCGMGAVADAVKTTYDHIIINDSLKCSAHPTNPVGRYADANPKLLPNDT